MIRAVSGGRSTGEFSPFAVCIGLVALTIAGEELRVLLKKRVEEPFKGGWELPGGFVQRGEGRQPESLDEIAARTLERDMGRSLRRSYLTQWAAYSDEHDPRGDVICVAYLAINPPAPGPSSCADPSGARWLPVDLVLDESLGVAFNHQLIIQEAVERTRELIEASALALAFCDEWFAMPSLRRVYEIVWDLPRDALDAGGFHKRFAKMTNIVEPVSDEELEAVRAWQASHDVQVDASSPGSQATHTGTQASRGRKAWPYRAGPLVWSEGSPARLERPIERPWQSWPGDRLESPRPATKLVAEQPDTALLAVADAPLQEAREIIWDRGRSRRVIYYGELAAKLHMHLRSTPFFTLLDSISRDAVAKGGPLVTSLVINRRTGMPGQRFFGLAKELGFHFTNLREFADLQQQATFEWIGAQVPSPLDGAPSSP